MTDISNNFLITINRGDYFKAPLFINAGDFMNPLRYILQGTDKVYLSIMEPNQLFERGIIRKIYTKDNLNAFGDVVLELNESDTEYLVPGKYYYEIKLVLNRNNRDYILTICPKKQFILF